MHRPQQRYRNYNRNEPVVEDLREKLNRMRLEKSNNPDKDERNTKLPPPDPPYNFLKDPLRGDAVNKKNPKKFNKNEPRMADESRPKGIRDILKQPININVEISRESGERKCTLDESKSIEIPVVQKQYSKRPQFRRNPGEFHKQHDGKNNVVFENSNRRQQEPKRNYEKGCDQLSPKNYAKDNLKKHDTSDCKNKEAPKPVKSALENDNSTGEPPKDAKSDN